MATLRQIQQLTTEALEILETLGIPTQSQTVRRREKMAKAFAALADIKLPGTWTNAKDDLVGYRLRSREIINFMNLYLGEKIADSSYDDIRREDLVLPVEAFIVLKSAKNPNANTNDGTRGYALNPAAAEAIRHYGTKQWLTKVEIFLAGRQTLAQEMARKRDLARIPIVLNNRDSFVFSAGAHNLLQKNIIEEFLPLYGCGAEVLYVGDTEKKNLYQNTKQLKALQFFELAHDKLPDVVAYSKQKNWLYLIEAVTTANPIDELRRRTLTQLTSQCSASVIFITAFPNRATYRKFAKDIAWETEVWIADAPEHMIHFNGHKFLGPYAAHTST
ncbi:MAG: BsuBI/PstI family type II restriction endonuclease [Cytophagales bacterium]|nr:BsuBI/PstI family type II restriction endonuclease [Cytophagales bacterium]